MRHVRTVKGWRRAQSLFPHRSSVIFDTSKHSLTYSSFPFQCSLVTHPDFAYSPWGPQSLQPSLVSTVDVLQLVVCGFVLSCPGWPVAAGFFSSLWTPWLTKLSMEGRVSLGTAFQKRATQTSWLWHRNSSNYLQRSVSTWLAACSPYQMAQLALKNVCNVKIPCEEKSAVSYVGASFPNFSLCSCSFHEECAKGTINVSYFLSPGSQTGSCFLGTCRDSRICNWSYMNTLVDQAWFLSVLYFTCLPLMEIQPPRSLTVLYDSNCDIPRQYSL